MSRAITATLLSAATACLLPFDSLSCNLWTAVGSCSPCPHSPLLCPPLPPPPRCFPTKAIALWTATGDADHVWIVGSYFHYSVPGGFSAPVVKDISPKGGLFGKTDPMYVVYGSKLAAAPAAEEPAPQA